MANPKSAKVPLRLCVWLPGQDGDEQRVTLDWELAVAELPLYLDPQGPKALHVSLMQHVQRQLLGRRVERIYWYGEKMEEQTLHPVQSTAELTRGLFDCLQQALSRPRESVGSGGSSDIQVAPQSSLALTSAATGSEASWSSAAVRAKLRAAEANLPDSLVNAVPDTDFSVPMLQKLLGQGSESCLPTAGSTPLTRKQVAAVLLLWARRCLKRQDMRFRLTEQFRRVSKTWRRLKVVMAGRSPSKFDPALVEAGTATYERVVGPFGGVFGAGVSPNGLPLDPRHKLVNRFRLWPVQFSRGPHLRPPRVFDAIFLPRAWGGTAWAPPGACEEGVPKTEGLTSGQLVKLALSQNKKKLAEYKKRLQARGETEDGTPPIYGPVRPPPVPSIIAAARTAARNPSERGTGLHPRSTGPDGLLYAENLRNQLRGIVLKMRHEGGDEPEPPLAIGECDTFDGMRWSVCKALGEPMQMAWGLCVAEKLHGLWTKLNLTEDGGTGAVPGGSAAANRHGLAEYNGLPGAWCPPKPRAPARRPDRAHARAFLNTLLSQKRIHTGEIRGGYAFCCMGTKNAAELDGRNGVAECLLFKHAMVVLNSLKRGPEAQARWVTLIHSQLADEVSEGFPAKKTAEKLRVAAGKISALEDLLIEVLAERSDAAAALHMHVFNKYQTVPLGDQISARLSATPLGDLLDQRFEHLGQPSYLPKQLGCIGIAPFQNTPAPTKENTSHLPFTMPAGAAAAPMALDNVLLNSWLQMLPALLRFAAPIRMKGVIPVGDAEAYDAKLDAMLRSTLGLKPPAPPGEETTVEEGVTIAAVSSLDDAFIDDKPVATGAAPGPAPPGNVNFSPSTQAMLCFAALGRYAWAAQRKGSDTPSKKNEAERLQGAASGDGKFLKKAQLEGIDRNLSVIMDRVRGATPKGAKPNDPACVSAIKGEATALDIDANTFGMPNQQGVDQIRAAVTSILDLVGAAARACVLARPPAEGYKFAESNILRSNRKIREAVSEALSMSVDVYDASKLDSEGLLAAVGEAVGDVAVEMSDLIRAVFKCLFKSTMDSIIGSDKIPKGAPKGFLQKLLVRKPCTMVPKLNATEWAAGPSAAMAMAMLDDANLKAAADAAVAAGEAEDAPEATEGGKSGWALAKQKAKAAAAFASAVKGGEIEKAKTWTTRVAEQVMLSTEGEQTMLKLVTLMTLDDVRATQGELSVPPPGESKLLLSEVVSNGVGGVAKNNMLKKLELATVYDSDTPMDLNKAYRLLPGRDGDGDLGAYALPLRYAEGEELMTRGGAGAKLTQPVYSLLDAGQRLRPDGSEFNVLRLHRIWCMQSAAADKAAELTLERMMDEHVTLTLRSCFYVKTSEDEIVLRGKKEVIRYLINDGFSTLGVNGTPEAPKAKGEGCSFVQPACITGDGDTRVVFGAGGRDACGSAKDRFRMGELITWGPWGIALAITRVFDPLATHYEWVYRTQVGNFAAMKKMLDDGCTYYHIVHHRAPAHAQCPPFKATSFGGSKAVFKQLDNEMSRMVGKVAVISPNLLGDKLDDLQRRREIAADPSAYPDEADAAAPLLPPEDLEDEESLEVAQQAYRHVTTWKGGGPPGPPEISVTSFAGRWLPLGEGPKRQGELVITVRETIGWKYLTKPPDKGDAKPSAARRVGLLIRELYIDTALHDAPPSTPGLAAAWALHKQRGAAPDL